MADIGGQLGNNNAGKNRPFWRALDRAIAQDDGKRLREAAEQLIDLAAAGTPWAVRELADRLDGKAAQALTLSDPNGDPLKVIFEAKDSGVL